MQTMQRKFNSSLHPCPSSVAIEPIAHNSPSDVSQMDPNLIGPSVWEHVAMKFHREKCASARPRDRLFRLLAPFAPQPPGGSAPMGTRIARRGQLANIRALYRFGPYGLRSVRREPLPLPHAFPKREFRRLYHPGGEQASSQFSRVSRSWSVSGDCIDRWDGQRGCLLTTRISESSNTIGGLDNRRFHHIAKQDLDLISLAQSHQSDPASIYKDIPPLDSPVL